MKKRLYSAVLGMLCGSMLAVEPLPNPYTVYSAAIRAGPSTGSGFFLKASNAVFLVTARHVLFDDRGTNSLANLPLWSPEVECSYFTAGTSTNVLMLINIEKLRQLNSVRYSTNHDVALVRVGFGQDVTNSSSFKRYATLVRYNSAGGPVAIAPDATRLFKNVTVGSDVFIFGYPSSLGLPELPQIDSSLPLMRKGVVAGKNPNRRAFILDCPSYQGNSGGPVVSKEIPALGVEVLPVIGVLVEWVPFREDWQNTRFGYSNQTLSNSGYSVAEPMDVVYEMLWE